MCVCGGESRSVERDFSPDHINSVDYPFISKPVDILGVILIAKLPTLVIFIAVTFFLLILIYVCVCNSGRGALFRTVNCV